jgi:thermitase
VLCVVQTLSKTIWPILLAIALLASLSCGKPGKAEYAPNEVLIKFKENTSSATIDALSEEIGLKEVKEIPRIRVRVYEITSDMTVDKVIEKYKDDPHIEYIEPNYEYKID